MIGLLLDLAAMAISLAAGLLLEFVLHCLVGEWWPLPWSALLLLAWCGIIACPEATVARLVSRYPWLLRWSQPAAPVRPNIARVEAERRALESY